MINLVFHDISNSEDQFDLEPAHFYFLINTIKENYRETDFRIYFDDGKVSSYQHTKVLKKETNFTIVCAVVSELLNKPGYLTSRQVHALSKNGVVISSHGNSHAALAVSKAETNRNTIPGGKYENTPMGFNQRLSEQQVLFQLIESKKFLQKNGVFSEEFVFPYGLYNEASLRINIENKVYKTLSTCDPYIDAGGMLRPRLLIDKSFTASKLLSIIKSLKPLYK